MKMNPVWHLVALVVLAGFWMPAEAADEYCEHGACFDFEQTVADQRYVLRSVDTMKFFGLEIYSSALYTDESLDDPAAVLEGSPVRLEIVYHRNFGSESLIGAAQKSLNHNPLYDAGAHAAQLGALNAAYVDVHPDDRYALTFDGKQLILDYNGDRQAAVDGSEFARAYLGIWLSEHAFHQGMRRDLLDWEKLNR